MQPLNLLPNIPATIRESSSAALEWPLLRTQIADRTSSPLGRNWILALEPSADRNWIDQQQQRTAEMRRTLSAVNGFDFRALFDPTILLEKARIEGAALDSMEIHGLLEVVERVAAWRNLSDPAHSATRYDWPGIAAFSSPLLDYDFIPILRPLRGKIEPDGSLNDDASPELRRVRRAMERQHRAIEESLRKILRSLADSGSTQDDLITVRGDRFVIPVKAELKRKIAGVIHGSSSSGQTVFIEPLEAIDQNNELVRLLDEEQAEIHRILVAMTRVFGDNATAIHLGACILAEVESHVARARFADSFHCVRPIVAVEYPDLMLTAARHPLLELRMRTEGRDVDLEARPPAPVPLTISLSRDAKQLIISGPNTGGKTVSLKTLGLLALMAHAGIPVPADQATFPLFTGIYADIGDAQSIERNLSSFSAHVVNLNRISREATPDSLVLLDELGSATDPEEGAALAIAIASYFLELGVWCCITTHLTSLKVYAANRPGVLNAAVGFDQLTMTPTYELRLGVPGASAGLNIAERLGLREDIVARARAQMTSQTVDIAAFLDSLHEQLIATSVEREALRSSEQKLSLERARLEIEGRAEQRARTKELETKLNSLLEDFTYQLSEIVKTIDDKAVARKIARDSDLRLSRLRREFSEQFNSTVVAHVSCADRNNPAAQPHIPQGIKVGDLVKLKSLGRHAHVDRVTDGKNYEVSIGPMKMRVAIDDIAEVESVKLTTPLEAARKRGNVTVSTSQNPDYISSEINVIGRTADEAQSEVERYLDQAFLAGLPRVRIVHGTGMGVLRRTLREYLRGHPHVAEVTEASHHEGGQGVTLAQLRQ